MLVLRTVKTIHLAVCSVGASTKAKAVARAIMMIEGHRPAAVCTGITVAIRLKSHTSYKTSYQPIVQVVDGIAILLLMEKKISGDIPGKASMLTWLFPA
jgi:hypothetical protein